LNPDANQLWRGPRWSLALLLVLGYLALNTSLIHDIRHEPPFAPAELGRVTAPCLCIYGDHSDFRADGERLAAMLPNASLRTLSGGHRLLNENAQAVTTLAEDFLNG